MQTWHDTLRAGFEPPIIAPSVSLADTVIAAIGAVSTHLRNSATVRVYLEKLAKGPGTNCSDSPAEELHKYVEMQAAPIDKIDPWLNLAFLKTHIMPVFEFEREEILRAVNACSDASGFDRAFVAGSAELGNLYDTLWAAWFERVAAPYQALGVSGQNRYRRLVKDQLAPLFDYTVFDYDANRGVTNRVTMIDAFPANVFAIVEVCNRLGEASYGAGHGELGAYFRALTRAHICNRTDLLEERWAEVDRAWVRIPPTARLVPVHGMEHGYEHPSVVSPEFRLKVRTEQSVQEIAERRVGTIAYARAIGLSERLVTCTEERLGCVDVAVFCPVVRSGIALNFRFAGQAVPNRQEVLVEGSRIFMDASNNLRMTEIYRQSFAKHATAEAAEALLEYITPRSMQIHTINHEFAHPVGRTPESDEAMGAGLMKNLEEGKASLLGVLADEWRSNGDPEYRLELIVITVARLFRMVNRHILENPTLAPYVRENRAAAFTLFEAGVISLTQEGLHIDVAKARSAVWFDALRAFNLEVIDAYQSHDCSVLDQLTEHYCATDYQPVSDLIAWVNRS